MFDITEAKQAQGTPDKSRMLRGQWDRQDHPWDHQGQESSALLVEIPAQWPHLWPCHDPSTTQASGAEHVVS